MAKRKEIVEKEIKEEKPEKVAKEDKIGKKEKPEKKQIKQKIDKKNEETKENEKIKLENSSKQESLALKKEMEIDEKKLEKIKEEIKKQTTITEGKKNKINKKIFQNITIAIVIVLYFIFLNLGFYNIKGEIFFKDLQVFCLITIGITIIIFEKAYQKDNGEIAIYGIEMLILSICTLISIDIKTNYPNKFTYMMNSISMLFAIYYVGKSIIIYRKMRKKALKRVSDIHKIGRVKE